MKPGKTEGYGCMRCMASHTAWLNKSNPYNLNNLLHSPFGKTGLYQMKTVKPVQVCFRANNVFQPSRTSWINILCLRRMLIQDQKSHAKHYINFQPVSPSVNSSSSTQMCISKEYHEEYHSSLPLNNYNKNITILIIIIKLYTHIIK